MTIIMTISMHIIMHSMLIIMPVNAYYYDYYAY